MIWFQMTIGFPARSIWGVPHRDNRRAVSFSAKLPRARRSCQLEANLRLDDEAVFTAGTGGDDTGADGSGRENSGAGTVGAT